MNQSESKNAYLEQVMANKAQVEDDLRARKMVVPMAQAAPARRARGVALPRDGADTQEMRLQALAVSSGAAVDYRITGWWRWKNVIVPPNAYVVHTRRGVTEPLHVGLGVSFRFDPLTDSFLVVPAAMQTIIINASCICRERQGVVVQGYVQWIIDDFSTAYKKLDFTDATDPMRVVNVQLREQAEAAIKDKVATMGIDEVLADKQPIIEELTARLRAVAEGQGQDKGLGLRIVTVQIKEAVVCSPRVWEMLQRPFRSERARDARLAELANESTVRAREAEVERATARLRIESDTEASKLKGQAEADEFTRKEAERVRRAKVEAETLEKTTAHEKAKIKEVSELQRMRVESEIREEAMKHDAAHKRAESDLVLVERRRRIDNELSDEALKLRLIEQMPEIAKWLPKPQELKSVQIGTEDGLGPVVGGLLALAELVKGSGPKQSNGA